MLGVLRCSFWSLMKTHGIAFEVFLLAMDSLPSFFSLFPQTKIGTTQALQKRQRGLFARVPSCGVVRGRCR